MGNKRIACRSDCGEARVRVVYASARWQMEGVALAGPYEHKFPLGGYLSRLICPRTAEYCNDVDRVVAVKGVQGFNRRDFC
jgi:hypothetical protein